MKTTTRSRRSALHLAGVLLLIILICPLVLGVSPPSPRAAQDTLGQWAQAQSSGAIPSLAQSIVIDRNVSAPDAALALESARSDVEEMESSGFPARYAREMLVDAERAYTGEPIAEMQERASLLERIGNHGDAERLRLQIALADLSAVYAGKNYSLVVANSREISLRKQWAFTLQDELNLLNATLGDLEERGIAADEAHAAYGRALAEFDAERYTEAEQYIQRVYTAITDAEIASTRLIETISSSERRFKVFLQKHYLAAAISLIIAALAALWSYNEIRAAILREKIRRIGEEGPILERLIREAQSERYVGHTLPLRNYRERMEQYRDRQIKNQRDRPLIEEELERRKRWRLLVPMLSFMARSAAQSHKQARIEGEPKQKARRKTAR